jgi:hypothetical protein
MSTLRVNTIQNSGGTGSPAINGLARAWVNFNGTGTVAIRASLNVSSITDNGTGDYTVNFTAALSDTNYSALVSTGSTTLGAGNNALLLTVNTFSTSSLRLQAVISSSTGAVDTINNNVSIFR